MSVLILGMEMPKGKEIVLRIDEKGEVYVYGSYPTELHKAVPVPPHGRLIDADALKAEGWELQMFRHDEYGCSITRRSLDSEDIPTIIEAEEG